LRFNILVLVCKYHNFLIEIGIETGQLTLCLKTGKFNTPPLFFIHAVYKSKFYQNVRKHFTFVIKIKYKQEKIFILKEITSIYKRIVIKVGTHVLAHSDGSLHLPRIAHLVDQLARLHQLGIEVILVSSGAVAAGKSEITPSKKTGLVAARQVWAAIGQVKLMNTYSGLFAAHGIHVAQVLTTKENFSDRRHYLNMKNCITAMLENQVIPIVNENDTIAVNELMFTDNDELSGLIASMMSCRQLIILSNVDGIFKGNPGEQGAELVSEVNGNGNEIEEFISPAKSGFGRGGMLTKYAIARKIASEGIEVVIANGTIPNRLSDLVEGKDVPHTRFIAHHKMKTGIKKWLLHSETFTKGTVFINQGASEALLGEMASSLLTIGIIKIHGYFEKGDIVKLVDSEGSLIGLGKAQYDSMKAVEFMGKKRNKPFIHYDYLVIYDERQKEK